MEVLASPARVVERVRPRRASPARLMTMRKRLSRRRPGWLARSARAVFARPARQVGAIPYAFAEDGEVRFLLVTSRRTGRWIFPKGGRIPGLKNPQAAAREAFEEAGVEGLIALRPVGCYLARTRRGRRAEISLYPMRVDRVLDDWPEKSQRRRRWVDLHAARGLGLSTDLLKLAEKTGRRVTAGSVD